MTPTPTPAPGLAFVRRIQTDERYRGSPIVIPEQARDKIASEQWEVVSVGAPEPCDDEDCERMHMEFTDIHDEFWKEQYGSRCHLSNLRVEDWVLIRKRSAVESPEPGLYIVRQDAVIGKFEVKEA